MKKVGKFKKICLFCGKEFLTDDNRKKYCNSECSAAFHAHKKSENHRQAREGKRCEVCGKIIVSNRLRKYCSRKCANKAKNLRNSVIPKSIEIKKSLKPKLSISEINSLARAKGLSYGQYVSKYGL